jgi:hypothetical protein
MVREQTRKWREPSKGADYKSAPAVKKIAFASSPKANERMGHGATPHLEKKEQKTIFESDLEKSF